jgi:hypothetical protein
MTGAAAVRHTDGGEIECACPRCGRPTRQRFYGPCADCYQQLGATMRRGRDDAARGPAAYEPKMNVVPNFVATKD